MLFALVIVMPSPEKCWTMSHWTVQLAAVMSRPPTPLPALVPSRQISGELLKPGCVLPSIVTAWVRVGNAECSEMVSTPEPAMSNWMTLGAAVLAFELRIA